jgi:hypothetical protein
MHPAESFMVSPTAAKWDTAKSDGAKWDGAKWDGAEWDRGGAGRDWDRHGYSAHAPRLPRLNLVAAPARTRARSCRMLTIHRTSAI